MITFKVVMKNKRTGTDTIVYKRAETEGVCRFMINNQYGLHYDPVSVTPIAENKENDGTEGHSTKPRC